MFIKINIIDLLIFSFIMELHILLTIFSIYYSTMLVNIVGKSEGRKRKYYFLTLIMFFGVVLVYFGVPSLHFFYSTSFGCGVDLKSLHFIIYGVSLLLIAGLMALSDAMILNYMNILRVRKTGFLNNKKRTVD